MFLKRQITGLVPGALYAVGVRATIYTEAGRGCVGVGGVPGEAVTVKAGAVPFEPRAVDEDGVLRMNLDKGEQAVATLMRSFWAISPPPIPSARAEYSYRSASLPRHR